MDLHVLQPYLIVALVCFILGLIAGVRLARPRPVYRRPIPWEE